MTVDQARTGRTPEDSAELVTSFVNTLDVSEATDVISTPQGLRDWLSEQGLTTTASRVTPHDVALAARLREGLRSALAAHHDLLDPALPDLDALAADLPLRLTFRSAAPRLEPVHSGVRGALAAVVAAVARTASDDTWERMKICTADDCQWAFVDRSRNRSRTWCAMGVCGNRAKTRSYRARRRDATGDTRGSNGDGA